LAFGFWWLTRFIVAPIANRRQQATEAFLGHRLQIGASDGKEKPFGKWGASQKAGGKVGWLDRSTYSMKKTTSDVANVKPQAAKNIVKSGNKCRCTAKKRTKWQSIPYF
jgi:hypothetical protein